MMKLMLHTNESLNNLIFKLFFNVLFNKKILCTLGTRSRFMLEHSFYFLPLLMLSSQYFIL